MSKFLPYLKMYAAMLGSIVTSVLAILPPEQYKWLAIIGVVCTAIATYAVPNIPEDTTPARHSA